MTSATNRNQVSRSRGVRAMPAARFLARSLGVDLREVRGSGPEGVILKRDLAALADRPRTAASPAGPQPYASSLARRLAEQKGVSLEGLQGSGPRGRIGKDDVLAAAHAPAAAGPALGESIPASNMRKTIARRLSGSAFTAPHVYFFSEVAMDRLLELQGELKPELEERHGVRLSVNDLLIKGVALTLREFPYLNASFDGEQISIWSEINVGLAVALAEGLIVPAIARADSAPLWEIAAQRSDLVERARARRLEAHEIERGTFTISSVAQYEVSHFTAIINPPQSAILSVGKTREVPVLENGMLRAARVANLGLSVDHRIIDGAVAAQFLTALKRRLENPSLMFIPPA